MVSLDIKEQRGLWGILGQMKLPVLVLLGLVLLSGCQGGSGGLPSPTPTPTPSPTPIPKPVEVGYVTETPSSFIFRPLNTGDDVTVANLSQGLFHLWGVVKVRNMDPKDITLIFRISRPGTNQTVFDNSPGELTSLVSSDGAFVNFSPTSPPTLLGLLCNTPSECPRKVNSLLDQPVILRIEVKDSQGRTGADERQVVVRGSPLPTPSP